MMTHTHTRLLGLHFVPATRERERAEMNEAISDVGRLVNRDTKAIGVSSLLLRRFSAFQANILTTNLRIF